MPYRTKAQENARRRELRRDLKENDPELYQKKLKRSREYTQEYFKNNPISPEKRKEYQERWQKKAGHEKVKALNRKSHAKRWQNPWVKTASYIYQRLNRAKDLVRWGNKYACYVGIKNFLTPSDLKMIWERDKAAQMVQPSIDRKDPDGHYTIENSRYIELKANVARKRWSRGKEWINVELKKD